MIGLCYYDGSGVPQDYAEAVRWLRKCSGPSEFGISELCLGKCYFSGLGVEQDRAEAARWFLQALYTEATQYDEICYWLSRIYLLDEVMREWRWPAEGRDGWDYTEDVRTDREGADAGETVHSFSLGLSYTYGRGVAQDNAEAAKWFRKAADAGDVWAQFHLAVAYAKGRGVPRDFVQAYKWFSLSASGLPSQIELLSGRTSDAQKLASDALDELVRSMTKMQIEEAARLAREWRPPAKDQG